MREEHIPAVCAIEALSFPQTWPPNAYRRELENRMAFYLVARRVDGEAQAQHPPSQPDTVAPARSRRDESPRLLTALTRFIRPERAQADNAEWSEEAKSVVGYAGAWLMVDEAHITTIAVHPDYRGKGVGEMLLVSLIERAIKAGAKWVTLEVRVSNHVAQNLYRKYTFKEAGVRRRYYSDNNEDALVMWTEPLNSEAFQQRFAVNKEALGRRMAQSDP